ncbi:MAG: hypothetical protein ABI551_14620 [Polyangiaceae bacterium]
MNVKRHVLRLAAVASVLLAAPSTWADSADDDIGSEPEAPALAAQAGSPVVETAPFVAAPVAEAAAAVSTPQLGPIAAAPIAPVAPAPVTEAPVVEAPKPPTKPVPAAAAPVRTAPASDAHPEADDPHQGALGPVRLGIFAGVGVPSIVSGEVLAKIGDYVGIAGDYGVLPKVKLPIQGGGAEVQGASMSVALRIYPLREAFFIGAAVGQQSVSAGESASAYGLSQTSSFDAKTVYLAPQIGLMHRFSFGLALGCDLGVRFPVSSSATASADLPDTMNSLMRYSQKGVIPELNILRLGYVL